MPCILCSDGGSRPDLAIPQDNHPLAKAQVKSVELLQVEPESDRLKSGEVDMFPMV